MIQINRAWLTGLIVIWLAVLLWSQQPAAQTSRGVTAVSNTTTPSIQRISPNQWVERVAKQDRQRILRLADAALKAGPVSIRDYSPPGKVAGPGDYYSMGDYWWPDPNKSDGLPYIQRDGQSNPANFSEHRLALRRLRDAVAALGAAYALEGEQRYADKAVELLRVFFLDPQRRMNPHLLYAQAIPGVSTGRGVGIIDTLHLAEVPLAIEIMAGAKAMTPEMMTGLRQWFGDYARWITTHPNGVKEMNAENNHSVACMVQLAVFARFTRDQTMLDMVRKRYKDVIVPNQMAADGSFPRELARTKPYGYSLFQLDNMALLCELLSTEKDNLWRFTLPDGRGMEKAMAFLYPCIADKSRWPYRADVEHFAQWPVRQPGLLLAGKALERPDYYKLWEKLDPDPADMEVRRNMAVTQPLLWLAGPGEVPVLN